MMLFLLIWFMHQHNNGWRIQDTQIYRPLTNQVVQCNSDLECYILDRQEQKIRFYHSTGELGGILVPPGKAPFELYQINSIKLSGKTLYAISPFEVKVFSDTGKFIRRIKRKNRTMGLFRVKNGWVAYPEVLRGKKQESLLLLNDNLETVRVLDTWRIKTVKPNRRRSFYFKPDISIFHQTHDGQFLYYRKPEQNKVLILELETFSLVDGVALPVEIDSVANRAFLRAQGKKVGVFSGYPHFLERPDGLVQLFPNRDLDNAVVVGKVNQEMVYPKKALERIVGRFGDNLIVCFQNQDTESFGLKLIQQASLVRFTQSNPIVE